MSLHVPGTDLSSAHSDREFVAILRVSRTRALVRGLLWSVPTVLLGMASVLIYGSLHFVPSGVSNRLVDYSIAIVTLPLPITALWTAVQSLCWILLCLWPGRVGILACPRELAFRLGPFGIASFDAARLDIRYPFELSGDEEDGGFEAFLPEERQRETLLPRIVHPKAKAPLHRTILKFARGDEPAIAQVLRPAIDQWQADRESSRR